MKTHITSILIALGAILILSVGTRAEEQTTISASPTNFLILENDLGVKKTITITNNLTTQAILTTTECSAEKVNGEYRKVEPTDNTEVPSYLELDKSELTIKAGATGTLTVRVKISASGDAAYPCVYIQSKTNDDAITPILIPFIVQNFKGNAEASVSIDIGSTGLVTAPEITIKGTVSNTGLKFFTPKGKLTITKDGTVLKEVDISDQIAGLMMPNESKAYEVKWTNTLDQFASFGDYTVDVKVSNDESSKVVGNQLTYTYINADLLILASIIGAALLAIIIGVVILKKR